MGLGGYITLPSRGSPTLQSGDGAHKVPKWLHNPCRLEGPRRFRVGDKIRSGPQVGLCGYTTPAIWGVADTSEWGTKPAVAHKWAMWLHNPWHLGGPLRLIAGHKIFSKIVYFFFVAGKIV